MNGKAAKKFRKELAKIEREKNKQMAIAVRANHHQAVQQFQSFVNALPFRKRVVVAWAALRGRV